jgi:hypothetical protein
MLTVNIDIAKRVQAVAMQKRGRVSSFIVEPSFERIFVLGQIEKQTFVIAIELVGSKIIVYQK